MVDLTRLYIVALYLYITLYIVTLEQASGLEMHLPLCLRLRVDAVELEFGHAAFSNAVRLVSNGEVLRRG